MVAMTTELFSSTSSNYISSLKKGCLDKQSLRLALACEANNNIWLLLLRLQLFVNIEATVISIVVFKKVDSSQLGTN